MKRKEKVELTLEQKELEMLEAYREMIKAENRCTCVKCPCVQSNKDYETKRDIYVRAVISANLQKKKEQR